MIKRNGLETFADLVRQVEDDRNFGKGVGNVGQAAAAPSISCLDVQTKLTRAEQKLTNCKNVNGNLARAKDNKCKEDKNAAAVQAQRIYDASMAKEREEAAQRTRDAVRDAQLAAKLAKEAADLEASKVPPSMEKVVPVVLNGIKAAIVKSLDELKQSEQQQGVAPLWPQQIEQERAAIDQLQGVVDSWDNHTSWEKHIINSTKFKAQLEHTVQFLNTEFKTIVGNVIPVSDVQANQLESAFETWRSDPSSTHAEEVQAAIVAFRSTVIGMIVAQNQERNAAVEKSRTDCDKSLRDQTAACAQASADVRARTQEELDTAREIENTARSDMKLLIENAINDRLVALQTLSIVMPEAEQKEETEALNGLKEQINSSALSDANWNVLITSANARFGVLVQGATDRLLYCATKRTECEENLRLLRKQNSEAEVAARESAAQTQTEKQARKEAAAAAAAAQKTEEDRIKSEQITNLERQRNDAIDRERAVRAAAIQIIKRATIDHVENLNARKQAQASSPGITQQELNELDNKVNASQFIDVDEWKTLIGEEKVDLEQSTVEQAIAQITLCWNESAQCIKDTVDRRVEIEEETKATDEREQRARSDMKTELENMVAQRLATLRHLSIFTSEYEHKAESDALATLERLINQPPVSDADWLQLAKSAKDQFGHLVDGFVDQVNICASKKATCDAQVRATQVERDAEAQTKAADAIRDAEAKRVADEAKLIKDEQEEQKRQEILQGLRTALNEAVEKEGKVRDAATTIVKSAIIEHVKRLNARNAPNISQANLDALDATINLPQIDDGAWRVLVDNADALNKADVQKAINDVKKCWEERRTCASALLTCQTEKQKTNELWTTKHATVTDKLQELYVAMKDSSEPSKLELLTGKRTASPGWHPDQIDWAILKQNVAITPTQWNDCLQQFTAFVASELTTERQERKTTQSQLEFVKKGLTEYQTGLQNVMAAVNLHIKSPIIASGNVITASNKLIGAPTEEHVTAVKDSLLELSTSVSESLLNVQNKQDEKVNEATAALTADRTVVASIIKQGATDHASLLQLAYILNPELAGTTVERLAALKSLMLNQIDEKITEDSWTEFISVAKNNITSNVSVQADAIKTYVTNLQTSLTQCGDRLLTNFDFIGEPLLTKLVKPNETDPIKEFRTAFTAWTINHNSADIANIATESARLPTVSLSIKAAIIKMLLSVMDKNKREYGKIKNISTQRFIEDTKTALEATTTIAAIEKAFDIAYTAFQQKYNQIFLDLAVCAKSERQPQNQGSVLSAANSAARDFVIELKKKIEVKIDGMVVGKAREKLQHVKDAFDSSTIYEQVENFALLKAVALAVLTCCKTELAKLSKSPNGVNEVLPFENDDFKAVWRLAIGVTSKNVRNVIPDFHIDNVAKLCTAITNNTLAVIDKTQKRIEDGLFAKTIASIQVEKNKLQALADSPQRNVIIKALEDFITPIKDWGTLYSTLNSLIITNANADTVVQTYDVAFQQVLDLISDDSLKAARLAWRIAQSDLDKTSTLCTSITSASRLVVDKLKSEKTAANDRYIETLRSKQDEFDIALEKEKLARQKALEMIKEKLNRQLVNLKTLAPVLPEAEVKENISETKALLEVVDGSSIGDAEWTKLIRDVGGNLGAEIEAALAQVSVCWSERTACQTALQDCTKSKNIPLLPVGEQGANVITMKTAIIAQFRHAVNAQLAIYSDKTDVNSLRIIAILGKIEQKIDTIGWERIQTLIENVIETIPTSLKLFENSAVSGTALGLDTTRLIAAIKDLHSATPEATVEYAKVNHGSLFQPDSPPITRLNVEQCTKQIIAWMAENILKVNDCHNRLNSLEAIEHTWQNSELKKQHLLQVAYETLAAIKGDEDNRLMNMYKYFTYQVQRIEQIFGVNFHGQENEIMTWIQKAQNAAAGSNLRSANWSFAYQQSRKVMISVIDVLSILIPPSRKPPEEWAKEMLKKNANDIPAMQMLTLIDDLHIELRVIKSMFDIHIDGEINPDIRLAGLQARGKYYAALTDALLVALSERKNQSFINPGIDLSSDHVTAVDGIIIQQKWSPDLNEASRTVIIFQYFIYFIRTIEHIMHIKIDNDATNYCETILTSLTKTFPRQTDVMQAYFQLADATVQALHRFKVTKHIDCKDVNVQQYDKFEKMGLGFRKSIDALRAKHSTAQDLLITAKAERDVENFDDAERTLSKIPDSAAVYHDLYFKIEPEPLDDRTQLDLSDNPKIKSFLAIIESKVRDKSLIFGPEPLANLDDFHAKIARARRESQAGLEGLVEKEIREISANLNLKKIN